jgi:hypothetical protein
VLLAEGHVVAFLINQNTHTLEYYDPEGLTILDRKEAFLYSGSSAELKVERNLLQIFYELRASYMCLHVIENLNKHQGDVYSNTVLISDFFKRRAEGNGFGGISTTACDNKDVRYSLVNLLLGYLENCDSKSLTSRSLRSDVGAQE